MKHIKVIFYVCLLIATNAHADFRKALDALQKTQGTEMLVEVEDAVSSKNHDGLSLFINTLSARLADGEFYTFYSSETQAYIDGREIQRKLLLGKNNVPELISLLDQAVASANAETQFDYAMFKSKFGNKDNRWNVPDDQLEKFAKLGVKKAENILWSRSMHNFYTKKSANTNLTEQFNQLKLSAERGHIDRAFIAAMVYLRWSIYEGSPPIAYWSVIPANNQEGIKWLKRYAANEPFGYGDGACKLADEYYAGDKITKNSKQAYLWYMQAAFNSGYSLDDCLLDGLRNMAYTGDLAHIDPTLSTLLKSDDDSDGKLREQIRTHINNLNGQLKPPSDLLALKTPINKDILYAVSENRYSLEIYKNGLVKYEGFNIYPSPELGVKLNSYVAGRDEWTISSQKLTALSQALDALKLGAHRNYFPEFVMCDTGEHWRQGVIYINTSNTQKTMGYSTIGHSFNTTIMAKLFKVQESIVPTQHLRCGIARKDKNYDNCIAADVYNFKHADEIEKQ